MPRSFLVVKNGSKILGRIAAVIGYREVRLVRAAPHSDAQGPFFRRGIDGVADEAGEHLEHVGLDLER